MLREVIILAGGLGTRLRGTVTGPKCMAPVAGRPFLFHVINYLRSQGLERFIFSLGYGHELIENYLAEQFATLDYRCSIEEEPLGTGGAIQLACQQATGKDAVIVNGDTLFRASIPAASSFHLNAGAECTLLLKPMYNFDRYGVVETTVDGLVTDFKEKKAYRTGNINAGVYLLDIPAFLHKGFPAKFSFEKDFLEVFTKNGIYALTQDAYFIDIGIPEDYYRAQKELAQPALDISRIDKNWTIFIDRDGVINHEKEEDYIRNREEFRFFEGVKEALEKIGRKFGKVIIVSNQRGVGRNLMTEADLLSIHSRMKEEVEAAGGRIDAIYYCTSTDNKHPDRKPNPGMAFRAQQDLAGIDLSRSVMIGNKLSDMLFARNAGMYSVFVATTNPGTAFPHPDIDIRFNSLPDFANSL